jgi:chromosome segregation ATPase
MNRAIVVAVFLASAPFTLACDKSGADTQNQVNEAQEKASQRIGQANAQATQAHAQAEQDIAGAQADFEQIREDYRHTQQTNVDALDKKIADLNAEMATAAGDRKSALKSALPGIRAQRDSFVRDLRALDDTSMSTFDGAKARLDKEWSDLKSAVDSVS